VSAERKPSAISRQEKQQGKTAAFMVQVTLLIFLMADG
jgi:hypothetical protein